MKRFIAIASIVLAAPLIAAAAESTQSEKAVFAGGCFWGIEAVFQHVKGVRGAVSGYAGGSSATARYEIVSSGMSDHAEAVEVNYDPAAVSYQDLLRVFFTVAHDPTQLNRQGPDSGRQYRSAIFYASEAQKAAAQAYIAKLGKGKAFRKPIVTQVAPLKEFFPAEEYHQEYAARHPRDLYIVINDAPKVANLKRSIPELYVAR
jgi:peptide-methionine (S)-S-oxide reductase